jgi:hypothetical protein
LWLAVRNRTYIEPEPAELEYGPVIFDLNQLNAAIAAELLANAADG